MEVIGERGKRHFVYANLLIRIFSSNFSSIHVQELHLHHRVFNRNFQDMSQGPLVSLSGSAKGT